MKVYQNIVFLRDGEAKPYLRTLEHYGVDAALDSLAEFDNGDSYEESAAPSYGNSDSVYRSGDYIMVWNSALGYIGLEREVTQK